MTDVWCFICLFYNCLFGCHLSLAIVAAVRVGLAPPTPPRLRPLWCCILNSALSLLGKQAAICALVSVYFELECGSIFFHIYVSNLDYYF